MKSEGEVGNAGTTLKPWMKQRSNVLFFFMFGGVVSTLTSRAVDPRHIILVEAVARLPSDYSISGIVAEYFVGFICSELLISDGHASRPCVHALR